MRSLININLITYLIVIAVGTGCSDPVFTEVHNDTDLRLSSSAMDASVNEGVQLGIGGGSQLFVASSQTCEPQTMIYGQVTVIGEACITELPASGGKVDIVGDANSYYDVFPVGWDNLIHSAELHLTQGPFSILASDFDEQSMTSVWASASARYDDVPMNNDFFAKGHHTYEVDLLGTVEFFDTQAMAWLGEL